MLAKATLERTAEGIQVELDFLEATIDVQCDWDGFRILLRGQSSKVERALLLLYQVICEAQFTEPDFVAAKKSILESLQKPPDPAGEPIPSLRTFYSAACGTQCLWKEPGGACRA